MRRTARGRTARDARGALVRAILPAIILVTGLSIGFALIYHTAFPTALYAALVTMTTLGDAHLAVTTPLEQAWVAFSAVAGVAGGIAAVASLATFDWTGYLQISRTDRRLSRMQDHIIIAGGGRVGRRAALEAQAAGSSVVVLDLDERRIAELEEAGIPNLRGDAREPDLLERAGLQRAKGFIAALPDDAANLYTVMLAREANAEISIAARAGDARTAEMLHRAGAQRVVLPEVSAGHNLAHFLTRPTFFALLEDGSVREAIVAAGGTAAGRSLRELSEQGMRGIVAAVRREGTFLCDVNGDTRLEVGDTLLLVGDSEALQQDTPRFIG